MSLDVEQVAKKLRENAQNRSQGQSAKYVRVALEAGGATTSGHPHYAKDWGATLQKNGIREFAAVAGETYKPKKGDIAVIQPTSKGNLAGHIQIYDGKNWISDFVQNDFWPGPAYRTEKPKYVIYRP